MTLQGESPDVQIRFTALSNGTIKTVFRDGSSPGLSLTPAPRHAVSRLVREVMAFVPYDFETATIVITNAAGIVTFNNGATDQQIETQDELPIRGGNLSSQVEAFLEALYGNFTF